MIYLTYSFLTHTYKSLKNSGSLSHSAWSRNALFYGTSLHQRTLSRQIHLHLGAIDHKHYYYWHVFKWRDETQRTWVKLRLTKNGNPAKDRRKDPGVVCLRQQHFHYSWMISFIWNFIHFKWIPLAYSFIVNIVLYLLAKWTVSKWKSSVQLSSDMYCKYAI